MRRGQRPGIQRRQRHRERRRAGVAAPTAAATSPKTRSATGAPAGRRRVTRSMQDLAGDVDPALSAEALEHAARRIEDDLRADAARRSAPEPTCLAGVHAVTEIEPGLMATFGRLLVASRPGQAVARRAPQAGRQSVEGAVHLAVRPRVLVEAAGRGRPVAHDVARGSSHEPFRARGRGADVDREDERPDGPEHRPELRESARRRSSRRPSRAGWPARPRGPRARSRRR